MPESKPRIRAAASHDLSVILRLLREAALPEEGVDDSFLPALVVAETGGTLLGCAGVELHPPFGLLRSVAVEPAGRGLGTGARLVRDRLAWAEDRGLTAVYLLTETAPDFFLRLGFEEVPRPEVPGPILATSEFSILCGQTAVVMVRPLGAGTSAR